MSRKFSSGKTAQADYQATIIEGLFAQLEAARRERNVARKTAIGNFQTADGAGDRFRRHMPLSLYHQRGAFDAHSYALRRHTGLPKSSR